MISIIKIESKIWGNRMSMGSLACRKFISFLTFIAYLNLTLSPCFANYEGFKDKENPHHYKIKLRQIKQESGEERLALKISGKWGSPEKPQKKHKIVKEFSYEKDSQENVETGFLPGIGQFTLLKNGELQFNESTFEEDQRTSSSKMSKTTNASSLKSLNIYAPVVSIMTQVAADSLKLLQNGLGLLEPYCVIREGAGLRGRNINLDTSSFENQGSGISSSEETRLVVNKSFINKSGVIESSGVTRLNFTTAPTVEFLGMIKGAQTFITASDEEESIFKNGNVIGTDSIFISSQTFHSPNVTFETPSLNLNVSDFCLDPQVHCKRTIVKRSKSQNFKLTHPYKTNGIFEIWQAEIDSEQALQKELKERFDGKEDALPLAEHTLELQHTVESDQGIKVYAPAATLRIGDSTKEFFPELLLRETFLSAYVSLFDFEQGTIAAKNAVVYAPLGIKIGRLIKDPRREVFSTMFSHSQDSHCHNLGSNIASPKCTFLGQEVTNVLHGGHLFVLPVAIPNSTAFTVKDILHLEGPVVHQGRLLETRDLILNSARDSFCEASELRINGDFLLRGKGNLHLKRHIGRLSFIYHEYGNGTRRAYPPSQFDYASSDPASLHVAGVISADSNSTVFNESSIFHAHQKSSNFKIESRDFKASLYQKFIEGTPTERLALYNGSIPVIDQGGWLSVQNYCINRNPIASDGCGGYAAYFLHKTGNFIGAQIVFPALTSFDIGVVLPADNTKLQGYISAPLMLIPVGEGGLALGSVNQFYIEKQNPVRDLMAKPFNLQTTKVLGTVPLEDTLKEDNKFVPYFRFSERFWEKEEQSREFYRAVHEHMVVFSPRGVVTRPMGKTVYSLSLGLLIKRVQEECKEALMRGYIFENRPIDEEQIKELHYNATEYLRENNLAPEVLSQALMSTQDPEVSFPSKPIIYYLSFKNEQELEELKPMLFLPRGLLDEARGQRGGKIRTHLLGIVPEGLSPQQMIEHFKRNHPLQQGLIEYFKQHPQVKRQLARRAIQQRVTVPESRALPATPVRFSNSLVSLRRTAESLTAEDTSSVITIQKQDSASVSRGKIDISGEVDVGTMGVISPGTLTVTGQINAKHSVLLASLFGDVHIKSTVERVSRGDRDNFFEHIPVKARIKANEILSIISANGNVIFEGAETHSGLKTQVEALSQIIDIPVATICQHLEHISRKRARGTISVTEVTQNVSSHTSQGSMALKAGRNVSLYGPRLKAGTQLGIEADRDISVEDVHHTREQQLDLLKKSRHLGGSSTTKRSMASSSTTSQGAHIEVDSIEVTSHEGDVTFTNPTLIGKKGSVTAPQGRVRVNVGQNQTSLSASKSKKSAIWTSAKQATQAHTTYSYPTLECPLGIVSKETFLQVIQGKAPLYIDQIKQIGGTPIHQILEEYHHSTSKKIQGPGVALSGLITLITVIATQGWGAGLAGTFCELAKDGVAAAMWNAGVSTLCAQAANSMLVHKGNPGKVLKDLTSSDSLKSVATAVATAGITKGLVKAYNLPVGSEELFDRFKVAALGASVKIAFSTTLQGKDFEDALIEGIKDTVADAVGGKLANKIGNEYKIQGTINSFTHKLLHASLGAGIGALMASNMDPLSGAFSGALGAAVAEIVADILVEKPEVVRKRMSNEAKAANRVVSSEDFAQSYEDHINNIKRIALIASGFAAVCLKADVRLTELTARNALDNNFMATTGQGESWSPSDDEEGDGDEGDKSTSKQKELMAKLKALDDPNVGSEEKAEILSQLESDGDQLNAATRDSFFGSLVADADDLYNQEIPGLVKNRDDQAQKNREKIESIKNRLKRENLPDVKRRKYETKLQGLYELAEAIQRLPVTRGEAAAICFNTACKVNRNNKVQQGAYESTGKGSVRAPVNRNLQGVNKPANRNMKPTAPQPPRTPANTNRAAPVLAIDESVSKQNQSTQSVKRGQKN